MVKGQLTLLGLFDDGATTITQAKSGLPVPGCPLIFSLQTISLSRRNKYV
jgi:hypothetical protein